MSYRKTLTSYFSQDDITYLLNKLDKSDLSNRVIECLIDYFIMLNQEYHL